MGQRIMNTVEKASTGVTSAQQNEQEIVMESINGHRGNRQRRSMMEFNVSHAIVGSHIKLSTSSTIICKPMQ
jgi:hypothetical protein